MIFDTVIRNGQVIDPKNGINGIFDVAISDDRIAAVETGLPSSTNEIDASHALVIPGIIDMHAHIYWGGTSLGVKPDQLSKRSGTTCWLDVGSAGPGNFQGFRAFIAKHTNTRVFALLHISFAGIYAFSRDVMVGESGDLRLLNPTVCAKIARDNKDLIRGIKVRVGRHASDFNGITPLKLALEAADLADLPLMCHIDYPPPTIEDTLDLLRPGDALTHCFRPQPNAPIDGAGKIKDAVFRARQRGVLFDIGHGMGSFSFPVAERMIELGFEPDVISSDVHAMCIDGPAFDNLETMNKFRFLGMPVERIVKSVTEVPASFIGAEDLGHLGINAKADITILKTIKTEYDMHDVDGLKRTAHARWVVDKILLDGKIWSCGSQA